MKVAVVGVGHWHAPIYVAALQEVGERVAAIADPDEAALERVGADLDCPQYRLTAELLERERPDFVFAHAPHDEMTDLARQLVAARVPFSIEKPTGVDWCELEPVATQAATEGVFASVALVTRTFPLVRRCRQLLEAGELGTPTHYYHRLFAGSPARYREFHVPWMLDPKRAGGGCLFNFGPHVIDLAQYLTGEHIAEVFCRRSNRTHGEAVEDLASLIMRTEGGALATAEVSYTMPEGYERYFSLTSTTLHCSGGLAFGTILYRDGRREEVGGAEEDWSTEYVRETLRRCAQGAAPIASLQAMVRTLRVINAAVESDRTGQPVTLPLMERGRPD